MSKCKTHQNHEHKHQDNCGHTRIKHGDHYDYLHDGHLHHEHNGHYDEHTLDVTTKKILMNVNQSKMNAVITYMVRIVVMKQYHMVIT